MLSRLLSPIYVAIALLLCLVYEVHGASATGRVMKPRGPKEIKSLPGLHEDLRSRQYTGYVTVGVQDDHHLFYWLVESEYKPELDPVVLWLTGGPGCSSMDAFIYEHGPFLFHISDPDRPRDADIWLTENSWSWSKTATMIYVDSPVGTGLSYSTGPDQEYSTDDEQTTDDLLQFLSKLLIEDFPHLRDRDLYIAGESYAGVYVPLLSKKVLDHNGRVPATQQLNLKGYATGNGVADDVYDSNGQAEFANNMGLVDPPTYANMQDVCHGAFWNVTPGGACAIALHEAYDRFFWLNPYDILEDCHTGKSLASTASATHADHTPSAASARLLRQQQQRDPHRVQQVDRGGAAGMQFGMQLAAGPASSLMQHARRALKGRLQWPLTGSFDRKQPVASWHQLVGHVVPCADRTVAVEWLNREEVRDALGVPSVSELAWQPCSDKLHYRTGPVSMLPVHRELAQRGLRALIYSGDHDFVVPFTGTRAWVYALGLSVSRPYEAWMVDGQVAGFMSKFKPGVLTFVTVKGAGHMVPQTSPERALHLITRFLFDTL